MRTAYTPELLARAQAWVSLPLNDKRYQAGMTELWALYAAITQTPVSTCRQCQYSDYAAIVVAYVREATTFLHPETVSDTKYTLANGYENEQFVHEKYATTITGENLTDEAAEFFIKNGFAHAIILKAGQNADGSTGEVDTKASKADLQARYKELYGEDAPKKHTVDKLTADIHTKEGENALADARAAYEAAFGETGDHRLGVEKLNELTAAKLAEPAAPTE
ncbi:hypothetical protein [Hymenobacter negativus]|uniref:Uncharacterized protein n=1 Tax=Hymenobacter negativus TaxID=2795026 RepID=A0ABS3QHW6_9BACT|nr:hypothetical protein [Hymenobacter negativus]MBO2010847.1 hypothetical protein [Hymenobacter negativus]